MKWNYLCEPKSSSFTFLLVGSAHRKSNPNQTNWMQADTEEKEKKIVMQMNEWEYANWINFKWIVELCKSFSMYKTYIICTEKQPIWCFHLEKEAKNDWWNDDDFDDDPG